MPKREVLLDIGTALVLLCALAIGGHALWSQLISPWLNDRPMPVENWEELVADGHRVGPESAPLEIVEFVDYECPACRILEERLERFRAQFPGQLAVVYRHWPLERHSAAYPAARIIECAAEQGLFEEFHRALMAHTRWIDAPVEHALTYASEFDVPNEGIFQRCVTSQEPLSRVHEDVELARELGGTGTPTVVINGRLVRGLPDSTALHRELRRAGGPVTDQSEGGREDASTRPPIERGEPEPNSGEEHPPEFVGAPQWGISDDPELSLGAVEGPAAELFQLVTGAVRMADGTVAVVDSGRSVVSFFTADGEHRRTVGGEGAGPGELRGPRLLFQSRYDSLVVSSVDRISTVSVDGEVRPIVAPGRLQSRDWARVALPTGVVVQRLTNMGMRMPSSGPRPGDDPVVLFDPLRDVEHELGRFEYQLDYVEVVGETGQRTHPLPFRAGIRVAPLDDGVVISIGNAPRLIKFDLDGRIRDTITIPVSLPEVTEEDREDWIDARLERFAHESDAERTHRRRLYRSMPLPEHVPVVESMLADENGGIWVELASRLPGLEDADWIALDEDGGLRGWIKLPEEFELFQAGEDFVLGVRPGEFGVPMVERYGLRRHD